MEWGGYLAKGLCFIGIFKLLHLSNNSSEFHSDIKPHYLSLFSHTDTHTLKQLLTLVTS